MLAKSARLPVGIALVAMIAASAWQYADMRRHEHAHVADFERRGRALLAAAEGVVLRECRGGRFQPAELQAALDETKVRFGLEWLALLAAGDRSLAATGETPAALSGPGVFTKRFEPKSAQPLGRGPRWSSDSRVSTLPDESLRLALVLPMAELNGRLADDRMRALITTGALIASIALLVGALWSRTRSAELRAELAESRTAVEGLETLRRLGAGLAHETRNPLGVVRGFAERLAHGRIPSDEIRKTAGAILEETDRTVARLDEFLLLSRPAALRRQRFSLRELCAELGDLLRPDLESVTAELAIECGDVELFADRDQIRRLLMNLLLNAIRAIDSGGHVWLRCEQVDDGMRVVVEDDGTGVPDELRETLFEPYVTGRQGGTGLGLAIARRIAIDHGYRLRYEPAPGKGTRMIVELPDR
jgi:signal transduction histidine kinase